MSPKDVVSEKGQYGQSEEDDLEEKDDGNYYLEGSLLGYGGKIAVVPFAVPSSDGCDFVAFGDKMEIAEKDFREKLKSVVNVRKEQKDV